jgi:hypothetical protein
MHEMIAVARTPIGIGWLFESRCATSQSVGEPRVATRFVLRARANGRSSTPLRPSHPPHALRIAAPMRRAASARAPCPARPSRAATSMSPTAAAPNRGVPHLPGNIEYSNGCSATSHPMPRNTPAQYSRAARSASLPAGRGADAIAARCSRAALTSYATRASPAVPSRVAMRSRSAVPSGRSGARGNPPSRPTRSMATLIPGGPSAATISFAIGRNRA